AHRILFVLFDGVQSIDVTGPLEVFAGANAYLRPGPPRYQIRHASLGAREVVTSSGLRLQPDADLATARAPDTLIVPGGDVRLPDSADKSASSGTRTAQPDVVRRLRALAPRSGRVMSVCTGALLLAQTGLLDGR